MSYHRMKDVNWNVSEDGERARSVDHAQLAVLMDIRDELKRLNERMYCWEVTDIPRTLRRIAKNTAKPRKHRKKK